VETRNNNGSGSWNDANTWTPTGVPESGDIARLDHDQPATVTLTGKGVAASVEILDGQVLALADGNLKGSVHIFSGGSAQVVSGTNFLGGIKLLERESELGIADGASLLVPTGTDIRNAGKLSLSSSGKATRLEFEGVLLLSSEFFNPQAEFYQYEGGTITLSDSIDNVIASVGTRGLLINANNTIEGSGQLGAGTAHVTNKAAFGSIGTAFAHSQGIISATGTNAALVVDTGPLDPLTNGGLMQGLGKAGLVIGTVDPDGGTMTVVNTGTIEAAGGGKVVLARVAAAQTVPFGMTVGTIRTTGAEARLELRDTMIAGGLVTIVEGSVLSATGKNGLTGVTLVSAGTLDVAAGASLALNGATASLENSGTIRVAAGAALDAGGAIFNNGYIAVRTDGEVRFASAVDNTFVIHASGGTVVFGAAVANTGLVSAVDATSTVSFEGILDNTGSVSASGGGRVEFRGEVGQQASGELLASGEASLLAFHGGASVIGGQLNLVDFADLEIRSGGSVTFSGTDLSLDASGELSVLGSTLKLVDSQVHNGGVVNLGDSSVLALAGTTLHGGSYFAASGAMVQVSGKDVLLDGATIFLEGGARLVSDGAVATLTNDGRVVGTGSIGDADLTLHNKGFIAARSPGDSPTISTGSNAIVNDGTITALLPGALLTLGSSLHNTTSGKLLSGKGTVTVAGVDNAGLVGAETGGNVQIRSALQNSGQVSAVGGGVLEALALDNSGKVLSTGAGSKLTIGSGSGAAINTGQIVADDHGTVRLGGGVSGTSDGQLLAQAGGRIIVVGAATGGIATMSGGGILDLLGSSTAATTTKAVFVGSTVEQLILGNAARFAGTVAGMGAGDTIALRDVAFAADKSFYDPGNGELNVTDGTTVVRIQLVGTYAAGDFLFASDGRGGTLVTGGSTIPVPTPDTASVANDAYVVAQGQALAVGKAATVLLNDVDATAATLKSGPLHGALALADDGTFSYAPSPGFAGIDSFRYQAGSESSAAEGQVLLYVVPTLGATLNLLALGGKAQIAALYAAFLGRGADAAGLDFWMAELDASASTRGPATLLADIASAFAVSDEARALYPFLADPRGANVGEIGAFLDTVYGNIFGRSPDSAGQAYWSLQVEETLAAGGFVGEVLVDIMSGAQDTAAGKDITTLMGKVAVSLEYVRQQELQGMAWAGASDIAAATELLQGVTSDPASVLIGIRNAELLVAAHA